VNAKYPLQFHDADILGEGGLPTERMEHREGDWQLVVTVSEPTIRIVAIEDCGQWRWLSEPL
jgi:hypothetical protein